MTARVGVLALARETFDVPYAEELTETAFEVLDGLDVDLIGSRLGPFRWRDLYVGLVLIS